MEKRPNNPGTNQLGPGVTEEQVLNAVDTSGYPLQIHVTEIFRSKRSSSQNEPFQISEEWCFVDRDTNNLRNIDLLVTTRLHGWEPQPRVRPQLTVLVECKQSQLPYIFFETQNKVRLVDFPVIAGLHRDKITITTDDDRSSWRYTVIHALDLDDDHFQSDPPFCYNLSKCVRKGQGALELSGTDAYNSVVLPLVKALQHFKQVRTPPNTAYYFDAHLAVILAVLDAPMVGVTIDSGRAILTASPWMRVLRHEHFDSRERVESEKLWVLDVVHKDFLADYINVHLLPFAERFAERVLRHPVELATSEAFVSRMGAQGWHTIENRMTAVKPKARVDRAKSIRIRTPPSRKR